MKGNTKQRQHLKKIREMKKQKIGQINNPNQEIEEQEIDDNITDNFDKTDEATKTPLQDRKISGVECAFATLAAGSTYTAQNKFSIHMNQKFVSKFTFYNGQQIVLLAVNEYCDESIKKHLVLSSPNIIVCGDGRYPIRRNSPHCSFDIINIATNKIISLGIADKQSSFHPEETFSGTSNLLESLAMKRAIEKLGEFKVKITGFIIDGDNKNLQYLQTDDFHPKVYRDPNHLVLSFERYLSKELSSTKNMIEGINDCFRGVRQKIEAWYSILIYSNFDCEIKKFAWRSTVGHLVGDHEMCLPHEETTYQWNVGIEHPEAAVKLKEILDKREGDFELTIFGGTTNLNEAFHKEQLVYDDKTVKFPVSQEIRDKLAVLRHNEGPLFEIEIRRKLQLPDLTIDNSKKIETMSVQRTNLAVVRNSEEFQRRFNIYRKKLAESHKKQEPGDYKRETDSESE